MAVLPYKLIDVGANLTHPLFKTCLERTLRSAEEAGVYKIIVKRIFNIVGVHPHDAKTFDEGDSLRRLEKLAGQKGCVAVGECGLDFNRNFSPPEDQKRAFRAQVALACRLKKSLFVHEREASEQLLQILDEFKAELPPVVIHCFTGTIAEAEVYLSRGFYIGLTGFLWKDKLTDGVQAMLRQRKMPLNRLLLETDSPFMYPNISFKKLPADVKSAMTEKSRTLLKSYSSFERNEPSSLAATCEMVAAFMALPADRVAAAASENAEQVFFC